MYTKNLNDGTDSTLSSFADNNKYREAVSVLEGRAAIQMDYNRLEKGLMQISLNSEMANDNPCLWAGIIPYTGTD